MTRWYGGEELAKVLMYFEIIGDAERSEFNICCPFHQDPVPSMRITLENGLWYCFGCGLSGNAYDFVKNAFPELDDLHALMVLEKILHSEKVSGLELRYKKSRGKKKESFGVLLDEAKDYYFGLRSTDWYKPYTKEEKEVLDYMKKRGIDEKILVKSKCKVNPYNASYKIIFPIFDNGVFCGWVSRTTQKKVEAYRKYLYNEGFKKRFVLCGRTKENITPYICEGFFDYLSLRYKGGVKGAVAIMGWHISDEQVKKLKEKGVKKVVCALDNPGEDKAGLRGLEILKKYFEVVPFAYPRGVKDPGEMTTEQLRTAIEKIERNLQ